MTTRLNASGTNPLPPSRPGPGPEPVGAGAMAVPDDAPDGWTAAEAVMESERLVLRHGGLGTAGKIGAAYAMLAGAKELGASFKGLPVQVDRAIAALAGIAVNLGEFDGWLKGLGVVGGIANVIQGVMFAVDNAKALKAEGADPGKIMGVIAGATQALGGAFQLAATAALAAFPPAAPVLEALSVGFYLVSGAVYLGQLAYDHRDWLSKKAEGVKGAIEGGWNRLTGRLAPEGRAGP